MKRPISRWKLPLGDLELRRWRWRNLPHSTVLVREGLGRAHAGEAGFNVGVDVPNALLDLARGLAASACAAAGWSTRKIGRITQTTSARRHSDREHDDERAGDRDKRDEEVLRAVVGQLGDLKKVACKPAHELAGAVACQSSRSRAPAYGGRELLGCRPRRGCRMCGPSR